MVVRSMQNQGAWDFAHRACGRLWVRLGRLSLLPALLAAARTFGREMEIARGSRTIILAGNAFPVKRALKEKFDDYGRKKER